MLARAEVMEAYVLGRLGEYRLAEARMWAATSRFNLRPELPEVLLAKLGLGAAYARDEQFARARKNLQEAADEAIRKDRWVWSLTALAQLATVDVLEYGPHPAVGRWQALARETTQRLWGERESRFVALRDRMSLRALTVEADRLGKAALMDPLTGLGNRRLLDRRLRLATGELCVVFVDVDHFKAVNDTFGHDVGDEVLIRVAGDPARADPHRRHRGPLRRRRVRPAHPRGQHRGGQCDRLAGALLGRQPRTGTAWRPVCWSPCRSGWPPRRPSGRSRPPTRRCSSPSGPAATGSGRPSRSPSDPQRVARRSRRRRLVGHWGHAGLPRRRCRAAHAQAR